MKLKWRIIAINLVIVLSVLTSISACGKKDEEGNAPGGTPAPIVNPTPIVDDDDDNTPTDNLAQEISGTYTGTLYTHHSHNRGQVTVTVSANNLLDISATIEHPQLSNPLSFIAQFYGFFGQYLDYFSPSLGGVGTADIYGRRVWVSDAYILENGDGSPQLFLSFEAVEWDYNEFGPWDIFYWQTYWVEYPGWMQISNLQKVGP